MTLKEFKLFFSESLSDMYPKTEIDTFFFFLMEEYLEFQRVDTILNPDFEIPVEKITLLKVAIKRLKKEEPIQYILGKTEFYGLPFIVDKNTLIPRPETEELVEWVIKESQEKRQKTEGKLNITSSAVEKSLSILDIGTGTGCIPISLAKNLPNTTITAIDISKGALKIAKQNALLNNVEVNFIMLDILKTTSLNVIGSITKQSLKEDEMLKPAQHNNKFDIIISNPPYVRELEKVEIKNNVLENEPHLALFVEDNNPLIFYAKIADLAKEHLSENGLLFFEINQYLGKETILMLQEKGFKNIELRKDFSGNDRILKASNCNKIKRSENEY